MAHPMKGSCSDHRDKGRALYKAEGGTVSKSPKGNVNPIDMQLKNSRAMDQWGERSDSIYPRGIYRGSLHGLEVKTGDLVRGERKRGGRA